MTWTTQRRSKLGAVAAIITGEGPQVLLIHGVGLKAEAWAAQIETLAQTFRVVAVDIPGHGQSDAFTATANLAAFTDVIAVYLDRPTVVVGHSFGAMIALDIAVQHSCQINGVAALNAIFRRGSDARAAVVARAGSLDGITIPDPNSTLDRWFGTAVTSERAACDTWLRAVDPNGYKDAYKVFAREDGPSDASLTALTCPALFITGADEPNSTPQMSRGMSALAPVGQAIVIDDAAHMMPMTHAPQVNAALVDFAKECF